MKINSLTDLDNFAKDFIERIKSFSFQVVLLYGDLGSGKTTFTQFCGKYLGISENIQSPTYNIMRSYQINTPAKNLYHIDLYRISDIDHINSTGILDLINQKEGIFFIEWPEIIDKQINFDNIVKMRINVQREGRDVIVESLKGKVKRKQQFAM